MNQSIDFVGQKLEAGIGISKHNTRNKIFNISNENIVKSRSKENINLRENKVPEIAKKIRELARERKLVGGYQKNTQAFTSFVIQSGSKDNHLTKERAIEYFKETMLFLEGKFSKENIAQATIHFDETTPHLHVMISNLKRKSGTEKWYCSSKRLWGLEKMKNITEIRIAAKNFALDFYKSVSGKFGFDVPSKKLGTKGKQTKKEWEAIEEYKNIKKDAKKIWRMYTDSEKRNEEKDLEIKKLNEKLNAKNQHSERTRY